MKLKSNEVDSMIKGTATTWLDDLVLDTIQVNNGIELDEILDEVNEQEERVQTSLHKLEQMMYIKKVGHKYFENI